VFFLLLFIILYTYHSLLSIIFFSPSPSVYTFLFFDHLRLCLFLYFSFTASLFQNLFSASLPILLSISLSVTLAISLSFIPAVLSPMSTSPFYILSFTRFTWSKIFAEFFNKSILHEKKNSTLAVRHSGCPDWIEVIWMAVWSLRDITAPWKRNKYVTIGANRLLSFLYYLYY